MKPNADISKRIVAESTHTLLSLLQASFPQEAKDYLLSLVFCGHASVNGTTVKSHTQKLRRGDVVQVDGNIEHYASRGAHKIAPVFDAWNTDIRGKIWLDVGSATGGFTDCLLERGATMVHAVDVGYNVLSYRLRSHARVRVHERTNILNVQALEPRPQRAVIDVSFRSLAKIVAHVLLLCEEKYVVALCKPQFEFVHYQKSQAHRSDPQSAQVNGSFSGVVHDNELRTTIVKHTIETLESEGVFTHRVHEAGLMGRKGNKEFFLEITDTPPYQ